jgi:HlyD family secretion protein
MDVQRDPAILKRKKRNRVLAAIVTGLAVVALTVAVSRLEPAAPAVADSASVLYFGTVKRGPMVREVRGAGTLVPEEIRWIPATTSGRVERIVIHPGADVRPGTVILELSNPDLEQNVRSAELDWRTALANLANQKANLANARLTQEATIVDYESGYEVALADLQTNQSLAESGLVSRFTIQQKQAAVNQAKNRLDLARKQLASAIETASSQLAPAEAAANQARAEFDRLTRQLDDLRVKATMTGQLQLVSVEVGQQVAPGTNLVRVSDPTRLKAVVRISETRPRHRTAGRHRHA